jgi:hypothetical protein
MNNTFWWKSAVVLLIALVVRFAFALAVGRGVVKMEGNPDSPDLLSCGIRARYFLQTLQITFAALALYFFLRLGFILFGELPA